MDVLHVRLEEHRFTRRVQYLGQLGVSAVRAWNVRHDRLVLGRSGVRDDVPREELVERRPCAPATLGVRHPVGDVQPLPDHRMIDRVLHPGDHADVLFDLPVLLDHQVVECRPAGAHQVQALAVVLLIGFGGGGPERDESPERRAGIARALRLVARDDGRTCHR
ncbi:MAG: hypothetical protein ACRDQZ_13125 [Mycobacteriales bacterium]